MTTDRELNEILAEIGREHRTIGAPEKLEPLLRAAAGSRKSAATPAFKWAWAAAFIVLAAVATAALLWQARKSAPSQNQQAHSVPVPQVGSASKNPPAPVAQRPSLPPKSAQPRRPRANRGHRDAPPQQPTWNALDEFVPLPVSEGLPPAAELSVVRVKLRGSDLQQYGLQAPADSVAQAMLAEFVVGEDGLPRAIRIVR